MREFSLWERECAGEWILASRGQRRDPPSRQGFFRRRSNVIINPSLLPSAR
jgi:hypothetical protein